MSRRQEREKIVAKKRAKGKLRKHKDFLDFVNKVQSTTMPTEFMTGGNP